MDLQLNLSHTPQKNPKPKGKKPKKIATFSNKNKTDINFVHKPKLGGKIIARKRKPVQNDSNKATFSLIKNNEKNKQLELPSLPKEFSKSEIDVNSEDNNISINISQDTKKQAKITNSSPDTKTNYPKDNFKRKDRNLMKDSNTGKSTRSSFTDRNFSKNTKSLDGDKRPTFKQISGLFRNNPEIPKIGQRHVKPIDEKLFSGKNFTNLNIHSFSVANLEKNLGLKELTVIQQKAVPIILQGRDVLVRSQTGSGKTLAYALPIIEALQALRPKLKRQDGVKALVIVPTRELAIQTYELFVKLVRPFTWIVPGYLIGGEKRKAEKARIRKGFNVLIGTPGRVSDHLQNTASLNLGGTRCLILDEADRLLDMGYEKDVSGIVQALESHRAASKYNPLALIRQSFKDNHVHFDNNESVNKSENESEKTMSSYQHELTNVFNSDKRQTVLLSATLTKAVETLAGLTMENPVFVDSSENRGTIIADSIIKPVQHNENIEEKSDNDENDSNDDDDLEIVPQEDDDCENNELNSDENESNDSSEDSSNDERSDDSDEESLKRKATIFKGVKAFGGLKSIEEKSENKTKNKDKTNKKQKKMTTKSTDENDSDSDYDFLVIKDDKSKSKIELHNDTTFITDSGNHNNPFQNAVQNAIAQDEMIIPSSVTQIYIVVPMKLRLVTLGALIVEKCVNPGNGKMLVFMGTQDLIDYHCELLSRVLTGKPPVKFASNESKNSNSSKKKNKFDRQEQPNDDKNIDIDETNANESDTKSGDKLKKLIEKEEKNEMSDDDYEYNYDGVPLDVYEAKMRAEKAFVDVEFFQLHGSMDQKTRTEVFKTFRNAKSGVLLCTDVAARGLDLPDVDCIVQYTGPISATDYVHRVGRTARAGNVGTAIMFLLPSEVLFVRQLEERRIRLHQEDMDHTLEVLSRTGSMATFSRHRDSKKVAKQEAATVLQQTFEDLVEADKALYIKSCKAFTSWMRFYSTYPKEARAAFDRRALHAGHAARALALRQAPKQIAKNAPKDKQEKPHNRLSNEDINQRIEKKIKDKTEKIPAGFDIRPTSAKAAKRDRMMLISEYDSGLEPAKKKKK